MPELSFKGKEFVDNHRLVVSHQTLVPDVFAVEHAPRAGELELVVEDGTSVERDLVLMKGRKTKLPHCSARNN